jgi:hypothetical protein
MHRFRRVTAMVPADLPDHLLRLALRFCGGCDLDAQFELGLDLMIHGLEHDPARRADTPTSQPRSG